MQKHHKPYAESAQVRFKNKNEPRTKRRKRKLYWPNKGQFVHTKKKRQRNCDEFLHSELLLFGGHRDKCRTKKITPMASKPKNELGDKQPTCEMGPEKKTKEKRTKKGPSPNNLFI